MLKNLGDFIMVVDDVLDQQICDDLIAEYEKEQTGFWKKDSSFDWGTDYRSFVELNVMNHCDFSKFIRPLREAQEQLYTFYKEQTGSEFLVPYHLCGIEGIRMKKYEANDKDQFGWHADVGDAASSRRQLAMFTYLNDVEEGGETVFKGISGEDAIVKPKRGRTVIFPPNFMFPHKGLKPVSGPKYLISQYIHYV